jgi:hypothetical protein
LAKNEFSLENKICNAEKGQGDDREQADAREQLTFWQTDEGRSSQNTERKRENEWYSLPGERIEWVKVKSGDGKES